jgi:lysophospholipase L1-like esterase
MPLRLPSGATVLFQGDSITDSGRRSDPEGLGDGYARLSVELLRGLHPDSGVTFVNRGISGNRVVDLRARWDDDAIAVKPDLVSVMIGINDTWHRYIGRDLTTTEAYERDYRHILARLRDETPTRFLLIEPFLVPVRPEQWSWREDLDPRIHAVRRLAEEFDAALLSADGLLNQAAREVGGAQLIAVDGVHLTPFGHGVLARAWTELVSVE